jgi:hypothetical protein
MRFRASLRLASAVVSTIRKRGVLAGELLSDGEDLALGQVVEELDDVTVAPSKQSPVLLLPGLCGRSVALP